MFNLLKKIVGVDLIYSVMLVLGVCKMNQLYIHVYPLFF